MKLTESQRAELLNALRDPQDIPGPLDEIICQDIDKIEPIIARWISEQQRAS